MYSKDNVVLIHLPYHALLWDPPPRTNLNTLISKQGTDGPRMVIINYPLADLGPPYTPHPTKMHDQTRHKGKT